MSTSGPRDYLRRLPWVERVGKSSVVRNVGTCWWPKEFLMNLKDDGTRCCPVSMNCSVRSCSYRHVSWTTSET